MQVSTTSSRFTIARHIQRPLPLLALDRTIVIELSGKCPVLANLHAIFTQREPAGGGTKSDSMDTGD